MDAHISDSVDVCVIGGGIAGLAFAQLFRRQCPEYSLLVLDGKDAGDDGKSVVTNPTAIQTLSELVNLKDIIHPISRVCVSFMGKANNGALKESEALAYSIDHQIIKKKLAAGIDIRKTRVSTVSPSATVTTNDEQKIQPRLLVVACGGNFLPPAFQTRKYPYHQAVLSLSATINTLPPDTAYQRFSNNGILVLVPRHDGKAGVVICAPPSTAARLNTASDDDLSAYLSEQFDLDIRTSGKRHTYTPLLTQTRPLADANIALIGPAATTLHPVGAQSIALGIADARQLAALCTKTLLPANLKSYADKRLTAHRLTVGKTHALALGTHLRFFPFRLLGAGVSALLTRPPAKRFLLSVIR